MPTVRPVLPSRLHALARGCLVALATAATTAPVLAQDGGPVQRVEVTGSSIRRIASEGALPIDVIRASDLATLGVGSVAQAVDRLTANAANADNATSRNNVFGSEQDRLTGGASFANLRGLGPSGTLVLLNGRRIAAHGMSGGAVDLDAIPLAAVERIEVLKDGASALYGTDAVGGVINFILKRDFSGVEVGLTWAQPQRHGGTTRRFGITAGWGSLESNGFNVMGSVSFDKNDILRGIDRDWASGYQPGMRLTPDTTSSPHANVVGANGTALPGTGSTVGNTDPTKYTNLNLLAMQGACEQSPFGVPLAPNVEFWDKSGYSNASSRYRCGTDYGRQFMLLAPKEGYNALVRGNVRLGDSFTGFAEILASRAEVLAEFTPYQFSSTANARANYPVGGPYYLNLKAQGANDFDPTKPIAYRLRMWDWGYRTLNNVSENQRAAVGVEGDWRGYFVKAGLSYGKGRAWSEMVDGYAYAQPLLDALASGKINPFVMPGQTQSAEAQQLIESTKARGRIFGGETTLVQADASASGTLMPFLAGTLDFGVGVDLRRESYTFSGTQNFSCISSFAPANLNTAVYPNAVMGCPSNPVSPERSRDIWAVYGELLAPITKSLQLTLQLRHDHYSQFGSTTNPKIAFRFQPADMFMMRGSYNTGFRAPTVQQLYLGTQEQQMTGQYRDPILCADLANPRDATQCSRSSLPYRTGGNTTLKPEISKQAMLGFALQPVRDVSLTLDWWRVDLADRIRLLTADFVLKNTTLFPNNIVRDPNTGVVQYVQAGWINASTSSTEGLDATFGHSMALGEGARLRTSLNLTHMLSHKERVTDLAPMQQYVGEWTNTTLYLPWKVSGSLGWSNATWGTTLSFQHKSSYLDEDMSAYDDQAQRRSVSAYTTFNLTAAYTGIRGLTLAGGIVNLFDTKPPFTWHNVDNVVGAGWDPRVADPRGRTFQLSVSYRWQ